jgi:hypothetical protein
MFSGHLAVKFLPLPVMGSMQAILKVSDQVLLFFDGLEQAFPVAQWASS